MTYTNLSIKKQSFRNVRIFFAAKVFALLLGMADCAAAAVVTWTGGSATSDNWNIAANWDTGVPQNNDSLVFNAAVGAGQITNNLSGRTFAQISFIGVGSSFFVYGNPITLTGGITQSSSGGANTVHFDITLATNNQTFAVTGSGVGSALTLAGDLDLNGRNLTVNVTDSGTELTMSGAVSGTGNITRGTGAGGLRFSGSAANTYVGNTTINGGYIFAIKNNGVISLPGDVFIGNGSGVDTLLMGSDNQFSAASDVTIRDGGVLDNNNETNIIAALNFIDGGTVDMTTGRLQLGGTVTVTGSGVSNCIINGNLHLGSATRTFNIANTAQSIDLDINAVVSGGTSGSPFFFPAGIIKSGAGVLRLSGVNTYSGATTINDGQITANNNKALGGTGIVLNGSSATFVNSNAVLLLNDAHITNEVLTLNSTNPNGALQDNLTGDWIGDITLSTNVVIEASSLLQLGGLISGPGGFTKVGANTLRMIGTDVNTYAGTTIVNVGTLELDRTVFDGCIPGDLVIGDGVGTDVVRNLVLNQIDNASHVTVNVGGLLDGNNLVEGIGDLELTGGAVDSGTSSLVLFTGGVTANPSSTTATIDGTLSLANTVRTFDVPSGTASPELLVNAVISSGGITKIGAGNLRLTGANTYSGLTTISNGFIEVNNATALGSTAAGTVLAGTLSHLLINGVSVVGETLTNNSSSSDFRSSGPSGWSGNIVLNAQLDILPFGTTFDLSGVISGSGAVTKGQSGTLIYSGGSANTYTGLTTVNTGTLQLNKTAIDGAIQGDLVIGDNSGGVNADVVRLVGNAQIATASDVNVTSSGLLDLNEISEGIGTLTGRGRVDTGATGTGRLVVNGSGSTLFTGLIIGAGGLTKQTGSGTFTLSGDNTYTGTTLVSAGTLLIDGSQPQSHVTVSGTGTLGGTGTIGNITSASANVAPGASPGTLTTSNVVFTSSGDYFVELTGPTAGTDYDQLNVRGTNVLGNAVLHVTAAFTTPVGVGQQFTILNNDAAEAITGTFSGLPQGAPVISGGYGFRISYTGGSGNDVVLTLTNVPSTTVTSAITSGNGNHIVDPNECNNLSLVISNQSGSLMSGITATLSTTTPDVIITQPYSDYPNIAANGKGTNSTPFQISTLPSFVCGTDIQLQLTVNSSAGAFVIDSVLKTGSGLPSATPIRYDVTGPVVIPDPGILNSVAAVSGFAGPLTKVGVSLWLTHPVDGDLNIGLVSPDGVIVDLSSGNGGSGDDYGTACSPDAVRTTFDDGAGLTIGTIGTAPPFVGTFKPESPLNAVLGGTINGNWTLRINDTVAGGAGSLRCWSLFLYPMQCSAGSGACDYCLTSISGTITNTDLLMTDRIARTGVVASCGTPKAWPGIAGIGGGTNYNYDTYAFTNTWAVDACVTVLLSGCNVQAGVYLNTFNPLNIVTNYLGDSGDSTGTDGVGGFGGGPQSCSVTVPAGAKFIVTVNEVIQNSGCSGYTLQLSGLPCPPPTLFIDPLIPAPNVRLHWSTSAGGYKLEGTPDLSPASWATVPNEPIVTGSEYRVTNSAPPVNRFYRLNKP